MVYIFTQKSHTRNIMQVRDMKRRKSGKSAQVLVVKRTFIHCLVPSFTGSADCSADQYLNVILTQIYGISYCMLLQSAYRRCEFIAKSLLTFKTGCLKLSFKLFFFFFQIVYLEIHSSYLQEGFSNTYSCGDLQVPKAI